MVTKPNQEFEHIPGIRLYKGDKEKLQQLFPTLGYNRAIREIIRKQINQIEAKTAQTSAPVPPAEF